MALTKYNRRTVSAASGAVVAAATVNFFNQNTGAPVVVYSDAAGLSPIGTSVVSGSAGEVEVFAPPGLYRITVTVGGDTLEEITHEPITSNIAVIEGKTPIIGMIGLDTPLTDSILITSSGGLSEFVDLGDFRSGLAFTTAEVTEDPGFLYFTAQRVRDTVLTGLSTATNAVITAVDTVLGALGKLQKQITDNLSTLTSHTSNTSNPHSVTKSQVGLGNVDNTSDVNKPVSTAQAAALALKKDKSTAFNNKIVIFGSSVAYGTGASTLANGWAGLLATALSGTYNVVNKSVGGDTTALLISRFYTDVVPENPGAVVIALSTANEGLPGSGDPKAVIEQYLKGIEKLIKMCKAEGYAVYLAGVYPNNVYTATEYLFLKQTEDAMQRFGLPYFGFLGTVDDGTGKWLTGTYSDAGHPNDTGHSMMFGAIDLTVFNRGVTRPVPGMVKTKNVIRYNSTTFGTVPIGVTFNSSCKTITAAVRVRRITGSPGQSILSLEGTSSPAVRIRNNSDATPPESYQVTDSASAAAGRIASTVLSSDRNEHLLVISCNIYSGFTKFYIDGVLIGSATISSLSNITGVNFGNRAGGASDANGYEYSDFMVWRTCLRDEQVKNLAAGIMPHCSQVIYSPIVDEVLTANARLINLALSDDDLLCGFAGTIIGPNNDLDTETTVVPTATCGTSGTITLASDSGLQFVKTGRRVMFSGYVNVSSVSSPVGVLYINGLPFANGVTTANGSAVAVRADGLDSGATTSIQGVIAPGESRITLEHFKNGVKEDLASHVISGSKFHVAGFYLT